MSKFLPVLLVALRLAAHIMKLRSDRQRERLEQLQRLVDELEKAGDDAVKIKAYAYNAIELDADAGRLRPVAEAPANDRA